MHPEYSFRILEHDNAGLIRLYRVTDTPQLSSEGIPQSGPASRILCRQNNAFARIDGATDRTGRRRRMFLLVFAQQFKSRSGRAGYNPHWGHGPHRLPAAEEHLQISRLAPMTGNKNVASGASDVSGWDPNRTRMRSNDVMPTNPDVTVSVPALVSGNPHIARTWYRAGALNNHRRRRHADDRLGHDCGGD